jgi:hypothetical protein
VFWFAEIIQLLEPLAQLLLLPLEPLLLAQLLLQLELLLLEPQPLELQLLLRNHLNSLGTSCRRLVLLRLLRKRYIHLILPYVFLCYLLINSVYYTHNV